MDGGRGGMCRGAEGGGEWVGDVHQAASTGEVAMLVELVQQDPSLLELHDAEGLTPLAQAVSSQQLGAVKRLVKLGANIHVQDHFGRTCLCIAAYQGWYQGAVYLLRHGAKQNVCDKAGRSPLQAATYNTDTRTLSLFLQNLSVEDINHIDNEHMTALHWSAFHQRPDHLQLLLESGADINARDIDGKTSLHWAAQNGSARCAVLLLGRWGIGSRAACEAVNAVDHSGKSPAHFAAAAGHYAVLGQLAAVPGCNLEARDPDDRMPLHWAAAMGQTQCVAALLRLNVSPNARDAHGGTPLEYASQAASSECKRLLQAAMNMSAGSGEEDITPRSSRTRRGPLDFFKDLLMPKRKGSFNKNSGTPDQAPDKESTDISGVYCNPPPTPNHVTKVSPVGSRPQDSRHDGRENEISANGPGETTRWGRPISLPVVTSLGKDSSHAGHGSPNGDVGTGGWMKTADKDPRQGNGSRDKKSGSREREKKSGASLPSIHNLRSDLPQSPSASLGGEMVPVLNLPPDSRLRTPRLKELKPVRGPKAFAGKNESLVHGRVAALQSEREGGNRSPTPPAGDDSRPLCHSPIGPSPLAENRSEREKRNRGRGRESKVKSDVVYLELSSFSPDNELSPVGISDTFPHSHAHPYPSPLVSSPSNLHARPGTHRGRRVPSPAHSFLTEDTDAYLDTNVSTPVFPCSEDSDDGLPRAPVDRHCPQVPYHSATRFVAPRHVIGWDDSGDEVVFSGESRLKKSHSRRRKSRQATREGTNSTLTTDYSRDEAGATEDMTPTVLDRRSLDRKIQSLLH